MPKYREEAFALIGRYVVTSIIVTIVLIMSVDAVPFWCGFPLTTIWMIASGTLSDVTSDKDCDDRE